MKRVRLLLCMLSLAGLALLTACNEDGGDGTGGGNPDPGNPDPGNTNGIAPARIGDKLMTVEISNGSAPFASDGSYTIAFGPSDESGNGSFTVNDISDPVSDGTYTYTKTGDNAALIVMQDSELGEVQATLTFDSPTTGSIRSESSDEAFEEGAFVLE